MSRKTATTSTRIAAVGAAALGLSAGLAATPAQAASGMTAKLTVLNQNSNNQYWVATEGVVSMTQAQAQSYINSGHTMQMRLWGDDPSSDDLLYGPYFRNGTGGGSGQLSAQSDGLHYFRTVLLSGSTLNEDSCWCEPSGDELYVGVRFVTPDGSTLRSAETNRVNGSF